MTEFVISKEKERKKEKAKSLKGGATSPHANFIKEAFIKLSIGSQRLGLEKNESEPKEI